MTKYGDLINQARKPENQVTDPLPDPEVNLGAKIKRSHRAYWTSQAKLKNITVTQVIIDALIEKFGYPPNW